MKAFPTLFEKVFMCRDINCDDVINCFITPSDMNEKMAEIVEYFFDIIRSLSVEGNYYNYYNNFNTFSELHCLIQLLTGTYCLSSKAMIIAFTKDINCPIGVATCSRTITFSEAIDVSHLYREIMVLIHGKSFTMA